MPELSACPTDIRSDAVPQAWLDRALAEPWCWRSDDDDLAGEPPRYLIWYVADRDAFFEARRTQLPGPDGQRAEYKGYPAHDWEVSSEAADAFRDHELITDAVWERLRRARRAAGQKT